MLEVCPEYAQILKPFKFPDSKNVVETKDPEKFYRVLGNTLYIPPIKFIRGHLKTETHKIMEVLNGFAADEPQEVLYNWNNLKTAHYSTEEDAIEFLEYLHTRKEIVVDIETKGLSFEGNKYLAVGFCWDADKAASLGGCFTKKVINAMQRLFSRSDIKFIWHNGKFDITRSKCTIGLDCRVDEDTMLMHYVGINEKRGTHSLKYLGQLYLQAPQWEEELDNYKKVWCRQNKIKLADFTYDMLPLDILVPYLHRDTIATFRLYVLFKKLMREDSKFIYRKLIEASNTFKDVELKGVKVDVPYIDKLDRKLDHLLHWALKGIARIAGMYWNPSLYMKDTYAKSASDEFNVGSPKQLQWMIYQLCRQGSGGTGKDELELLNDYDKIYNTWLEYLNGTDDHICAEWLAKKKTKEACQFLRFVLKFRKLQKMHKTYVVGLKEQLTTAGRIHASYNLHGTETGRLSSSDPNMQNIPRLKMIKNIFVASPGKVLVQLDYSQAELRTLAVLSDDPWLKNVYYDGKDLHDAVALEMFGPGYTKEDRVKAKAINFGIAYGRGADSLASTFHLTRSAGQKLIDNWFKPMPKVKEFLKDWRTRPARGKECKTLLGRMRSYVITYDNKNHVENESVNFPIQSTASDMTVFSLIEINKKLREEKLGDIVITVHDSIIIETTKENAPKVRDIAVGIMKEIPKLYLKTDVPFKADAEIGLKWGALGEFEAAV